MREKYFKSSLPWILVGLSIVLGFRFFGPFQSFQYDVPQWGQWPSLETPWLYAILHLVSFLPVFLLSFDKKVHYYTRWKTMAFPVLGVALCFIAWDVVFTHWKVWGFNDRYLSGWHLLGLPWEEWLFFFTIPFASIFIYECLRAYLPASFLPLREKWISIGLVLLLVGMALAFYSRIYTSVTCLLTAAFLVWHLLFEKGNWRPWFYLSFIVTLIPFQLIDGILTGGFTEQPVVLYNPEDFSGWRLMSIPVEDAIYGMLLLMSIVTFYERRLSRQGGR